MKGEIFEWGGMQFRVEFESPAWKFARRWQGGRAVGELRVFTNDGFSAAEHAKRVQSGEFKLEFSK